MTTSTDTPFPGLRPFETADAPWFFGRDAQIDALYARLERSRFVSVVGSSGVGKSSLVYAGLIPRLAQAGQRWRVVEFKPRGAPRDALAHAFLGLLAREGLVEPAEVSEPALVDHVRMVLCRYNLGLVELVRDWLPDDGIPLLLLVDQFEEVFRYEAPSDRKAALGADEAAAFVALLLAATRSRDAPVSIMLTMRADYIGDCIRFEGLPEAISDGQYLVPRLLRDQVEEAIRKPVSKAVAVIDHDLVQQLLNDNANSPDALPVLQHALMRTWDEAGARAAANGAELYRNSIGTNADLPPVCVRHVTLDDYRAIGGWHRALSNHADSVFAELARGIDGGALAAAAGRAFRALIDVDSNGRATRRAIPFRQLVAETGCSSAQVEEVLRAMSAEGRSFVRPSLADGVVKDAIIDISHEALIQSWTRINDPTLDNRTERPKGWLQREQADGRIWHSLVLQAETNMLLSPKILEERIRWLSTVPGAEWARRYGNKWEIVAELLERSRVAVREIEAEDADQISQRLEYIRIQTDELSRDSALLAIDAIAKQMWDKYTRGHDHAIRLLVEELRKNHDLVSPKHGVWSAARPDTERTEVNSERGNDMPSSEEERPVLVTPRAINADRLQALWRERVVAQFEEQWCVPLAPVVSVQLDTSEVALGNASNTLVLKLKGTRPSKSGQGAAPARVSKAPLVGSSSEPYETVSFSLGEKPPPGWAFLDADVLPKASSDPRRKFFETFRDEWREAAQFGWPNHWFLVPHWSEPIWRAAGVELDAEEGAISQTVLNHLLTKPQMALSREAALYLLQQVEAEWPQSVGEALAARGGTDAVHRLMLEVLRGGRSLAHLPYLLDELPCFGDMRSQKAADSIYETLLTPSPSLLEMLPVRSRANCSVDEAHSELSRRAVEGAFGSATGKQLPFTTPVRVYISEALVEVIAPGRQLSTRVLEEVDNVIGPNIYRRFGVRVPGVRFRSMPFSSVAGHAFYLRLLAQPDPTPEDQPTSVKQDEAIEATLAAVEQGLSEFREWWVTADTVRQIVQDLRSGSDALGRWVAEVFTLTELKLILRGVLRAGADAGEETTVLRGSWLLGSLLFWAEFGGTRHLRKLSGYLCELQRAWIHPAALAGADYGISDLIRRGLESQAQGDVSRASMFFCEAVQRDREAAKAAFLAAYPSEYAQQLVRRTSLPKPGKVAEHLPPQTRPEVKEYLRSERIGDSPQCKWRLRLRLVEDYSEQGLLGPEPEKLHQFMVECPLECLTPAEAYLFGYHVLSAKYDFVENGKYYDCALELLNHAFSQMGNDMADLARTELFSACSSHPFSFACSRIVLSVAELRQNNFWAAFEAATFLLDYALRQKPKRTLELLDRASQNYDQVKSDERPLHAWLSYERARANIALVGGGDEVALQHSLRTLEALRKSPPADPTDMFPMTEVLNLLVQAYLYAGNTSLAEDLLRDALQRWTDNVSLRFRLFDIHLARKDLHAAWVSAIRELESHRDSEDVDVVGLLEQASVAGLLTGEIDAYNVANRYLAVKPGSPDHVRLLLSWALRMEGREIEARNLLLRRWTELQGKGAKWEARLALGDEAVWWEMLVGYYLGEVARDEVMGPLDDPEEFACSALGKLELPIAALRCEAHFYDALLQRVTGEPDSRLSRFEAALREVRSTGYVGYTEYDAAACLL